MPNTTTHPTLKQDVVVSHSFGVDHESITALAKLAQDYPNAVGFVLEIHYAADPMMAPVYTARPITAFGALGDRVTIYEEEE